MTVVVCSDFDTEDNSVTIRRTNDVDLSMNDSSSSRTETRQLSYCINQAALIVQLYIYMILYHTPTQNNGKQVKKGGRSKTVIGVSRSPISAADEYNRKLSDKDQATNSRWILVALCGPFHDVVTPEAIISECKHGTKGAKSKISKLINLNHLLRETTDMRPVIFLNRGVEKIELVQHV